ncbi:Methyltransferase type 12 [Pseudodesulfovibrio mercurii]|uniref:Methyltransferase type 12 n=1 Tax=Pseudodesulfovibrio mercurii TaxID=641491 RepID=F0JC38_9BACT|nr:methyltransferase [Pseudodesulfovibrio mercurii]EGB15611.1 Methyltransferase type 12 [Pseudodesulfovibrio mercurii]
MSIPTRNLSGLGMPENAAGLESILNGYRAYQVFNTALELGLFELLHDEPGLDREVIAKRLKVNGMFIRSFLLSLRELGLITEDTEKFANSPMADAFLVRESPLFQGGWINEDTGANSRWSNLTAQLQKDKPEAYAFDQAPRTDFIRALGQRSLRGELQGVVREILAWDQFPRARTVLDLGGGHGLYAIALCQANGGLGGVVFDKPHVMSETRAFLREYGMAERLTAQGGDIDTDDIGEGFDIVLISHVLYKFRKNMPEFFNKIRNALRPGGLLVSNHWFCAPGCVPQNGLLEMDKSFLSFGHPLCRIEQFTGLIEECGFSIVAAREIPGPFGAANLHLAVKTAAESVAPECETAACCSCC